MTKFEEIEQAKQTLVKHGYYTSSLFTVDDVQRNYECTEEEAFDVLDSVFSDEYLGSEINDSIDRYAMKKKLKHKE